MKKKQESDEEEEEEEGEKPKSAKKPAAKPRKQSVGSAKKGITIVEIYERKFLKSAPETWLALEDIYILESDVNE